MKIFRTKSCIQYTSLSAANNTEVAIERVVLLYFVVENSTLFPVPFLVTKENLCNSVVVYNTIADDESFTMLISRGCKLDICY